jgi:hypothetical protein
MVPTDRHHVVRVASWAAVLDRDLVIHAVSDSPAFVAVLEHKLASRVLEQVGAASHPPRLARIPRVVDRALLPALSRGVLAAAPPDHRR